MLSCAIICMLLVGGMAQKPPKNKPCCFPEYFTIKEIDTIISSSGDKLVFELLTSERAYDAISEQISIFFDARFFNGTEVKARYIAEYKKQVAYVIIERGGEERCFPNPIEEPFERLCVPDDAKFVRNAWLGEEDLLVESWYFSKQLSPEHEAHITEKVQSKECVPVSVVSEIFNSTTGENLGLLDARFIDFELGICDREHFFKIPEACQPGNAMKEPTLEVQKVMDKISRRRKFLGQ